MTGLALHAEFLQSVRELRHAPPENGPEVAFAGRSNAGKSSVLNVITGSRLAYVSKTPGRTRLINFFAVRAGGRLVDLPGYGFARAPRKMYEAWQKTVEAYLARREALAGLVLVMDCRRSVQLDEQELLKWTTASSLPVHVLLNKADKLGNEALLKSLQRTREALSGYSGVTIQAFSARTGRGLADIQGLLRGWLGHEVD